VFKGGDAQSAEHVMYAWDWLVSHWCLWQFSIDFARRWRTNYWGWTRILGVHRQGFSSVDLVSNVVCQACTTV